MFSIFRAATVDHKHPTPISVTRALLLKWHPEMETQQNKLTALHRKAWMRKRLVKLLQHGHRRNILPALFNKINEMIWLAAGAQDTMIMRERNFAARFAAVLHLDV